MYPHSSSHQRTCLRSPPGSLTLPPPLGFLCFNSRCVDLRNIFSRERFRLLHLQTLPLFRAKVPASPHHSVEKKKPSTISMGSLHTSLRLHVQPIKLVVFQRSYSLIGMGNLILKSASHLDAFSGYPIRSSLLGSATGVTTDTRALRPPRSSRTRGSSSQVPSAHSG